MGGRSAFIDVDLGDFTFKDGGKQYNAVGVVDGVKVLVQTSGSVKAPEFSHSPNRVYAIVQGNKLKHVALYDESHNQRICIDLWHPHKGISPHKHYDLNHKDKGIPITVAEQALVDKIKKEFNLV